MLARPGVETQAEAVLVHAGLARVRRRHRQVLEAFHLDGKDVRTISRELGISERAVEGRLRRARQAFRRHLRPVVDQGEKSHE
jgi:DNA-directed RNA polymerase specialized sigma24 family protein